MLATLDAIDWQNLGTAYGPAVEVPKFIRDLLSTEHDQRDEGIYNLYGYIFHQGDVYSATPKVIPFLIELLNYEVIKDKDAILAFLFGLTETCKPQILVHELYNQIWEAIKEGVDTYFSLLFDKDEWVRYYSKLILEKILED